jgi:hypothetical protein
MDEFGEDDESEAEDVELSPDDALLIVGKAEDVSNLVLVSLKCGK